MTYKCLECGAIFEEGNEQSWVEPHGEHFSGCPRCGGAYEETEQCKWCERDFFNSDLSYNGFCEECLEELKQKLDYDDCLEYLLEKNQLTNFFFWFYDCYNVNASSTKLIDELKQWYLRQKTEDKILGVQSFLNQVITFITDDDDEWANKLI